MSTTTAHTIADKVNPTPPPSRDLSYLVSAWDRDHQLLQAPARVRARRNRLSALVAPHASVLRVARLVTLRASPSEVFAAVADEIARCLTGDNASVCRFEGDEVVVLALSHLEPGMNNKPVVGEHHTLNDDNIATKVMHTGRPARLDSSELKIAPGSIAARLRETGLRCTVTVALPPRFDGPESDHANKRRKSLCGRYFRRENVLVSSQAAVGPPRQVDLSRGAPPVRLAVASLLALLAIHFVGIDQGAFHLAVFRD